MDLEKLQEELKKYKQEHLLQFWGRLSPSDQSQLYNDLMNINFSLVSNIFKESMHRTTDDNEKIDDILQPLPPEIYGSIARASPETIQCYKETGLNKIADSSVAVLLLAGGQGTRLGVSFPKGMFDVSLPSHKSLYQLQAERIQRVEELAFLQTQKRGKITWYIMTSEHTMEPTIEFFQKHNYFQMDEKNMVIFEQNTLPCFSFDGKIFLETQSKVARAPDGNGGLYNVLQSQGVLEDMKSRGIQYIHVYCVDNILVKMADPVFIGYCVTHDADCAAKVVEKAFPTEAVGVVCKVNGNFQVVEYSELSIHTAERRNPDGRLTFNAGSICNHFFTVQFLEKVAKGKELKHHVAKKKIPFIGEDGSLVKPDKPNGIKLEKFVFDVFERSNKFVVWEVLREDEFSPLKNADGAQKDTPTTARCSLFNLHRRYILGAGGKFIDEDNTVIPLIPSQKSYLKYESPLVCEISPLVSYDGEGLEDIAKGKTFKPPLIIYAENENFVQNGVLKA